jgi:hypothetical protein
VAVVYGIVKLSSIFTNQESANAKHTLEGISSRLEALNVGQNSTFLLQGFSGSENWVVSAWNSTQAGRPDKCYFKSCLCVCPADGEDAQSCQEKGFCQTFDYEGVVVEPISQEALYNSDTWHESITFNLPKNADECRASIGGTSSAKFARIQMNPNKQTTFSNDNLGMS